MNTIVTQIICSVCQTCTYSTLCGNIEQVLDHIHIIPYSHASFYYIHITFCTTIIVPKLQTWSSFMLPLALLLTIHLRSHTFSHQMHKFLVSTSGCLYSVQVSLLLNRISVVYACIHISMHYNILFVNIANVYMVHPLYTQDVIMLQNKSI